MRTFFALLLALPLLAAAQGEYDYHYWFDSQLDGPLSANGRSNTPTLTLSPDVSSLREGIHTFNISVADHSGGGVSSIRSNYFLRLPLAGSQTYSVQTLVDGQPYRTDRVTSTGMTLHYDLDATALPYGLHSLSLAVINESGAVSSFHESMFFRVPTDAENSAMVLHYMIDGKEAGTAPLSGGSAMLQLDLASISSGVHELTVYASDGHELTTNFASRLFVKTPGPTESYTYWLNGDYSSAKSVKVAEPKADLRVIDMLAVEAVPFRSKMFTCVPDAATGNLTLYARNELSVAFFSHGYEAVAIDSRRYTDQRVSRTVDATEIHPLNIGANLTETITLPTDNSIIWYYFDAEPGQLVSAKSSIGCYLEIWNSSGEQIMSVSGADATKNQTLNIKTSGRYYLALHDVAGSSKLTNFKLTYSNLPTYIIVSQFPQCSTNNGVLMCNLSGNGFRELQSVKLIKDDISLLSTFINHTDNYTAEIRFDLNNAPKGEYMVQAEYIDSITGKKHIVGGQPISLENPEPGEIKVSFIPATGMKPPQLNQIQITNTGNISLLHTPFNIAVEEPTNGCYVHFSNFGPDKPEDDEQAIVYTDNLLGRDISGGMFGGIIPYLMPYETLTLDLDVYANPSRTTTIDLYAWAGEPWSEEFKRITSEDFRLSEEDYYQTNQLTLTKLMIIATAASINDGTLTVPEGSTPMTPGDNNKSRSFLCYDDLKKTRYLLERTANCNPFSTAGIAATVTADIASATGLGIGGEDNKQSLKRFDVDSEATGIDLKLYPDSSSWAPQIKNFITTRFPTPGQALGPTTGGHKAIRKSAKNYGDNAGSTPNPVPPRLLLHLQISVDPNDIIGPVGPSGGRFIGRNRQELPYTIEFENDPELATASALTIDVTNQLDGSVFDLSTFKATELNIGGKTIELPADHEFIRTLDLRPEINAVAQLEMTYDATSGKSLWHLTSLDPMTMEPTDYFEQGILPVNDSISHRGEGMISYTIGLKPGLADGTKISNKASIVFDTNAPIETPVWENIIDYTLPTAQVAVETADNKEFAFTFSGSDSGAGIWMYALYLRYPGSDEWLLLRDGIEQTDFGYEAPEALPAGTMFAVLATDGAGNEQDSDFMRLQPGDVDRSGIVDANDVLALSAYYMGKPVNIALSVSDVNSDGLIDSQDVLAIARIYLQKYPTKKQQRTRKYSTK